jgi:hypothetical protein
MIACSPIRMVCVVPKHAAGCVTSELAPVEAEPNIPAIARASATSAVVAVGTKPTFRSLGTARGQRGPTSRPAGIAWQRVGETQRLRSDLAFAASDRVRLGIVASVEQLAIRPHQAWVANELPVREILFGEPPVDHQARHELDPDGSVVWSAITREL